MDRRQLSAATVVGEAAVTTARAARSDLTEGAGSTHRGWTETRDGTRLFVREWGPADGPSVVLAHASKTSCIEPGSPWENGYFGSFNSKLRDELLHGEIFYSLREAEIILESWRRHYNTVRPHASSGYRPPAPEVLIPAFTAWSAGPSRTDPPAKLPGAPRPVLY